MQPKHQKKRLEDVHEIPYVHEIVKDRIIVNIDQVSGVELEKALAEKLRELLGGVPWLRGWEVKRVNGAGAQGFDVLATLPLPSGGKATLCVECKREIRPNVFRMIADRSFSPLGRPRVVVPVLALPFVSSRVAELCAEHGWSWYDLAGNCRLNVPDAFYLERTGRESVHKPPRPTANLSTPEAARVIRALLAPDNAGRRWTQREMALHFGLLPKPVTRLSLGLVNKVVRYLDDQAFIEELNDRGFRLRDPLGLLAAWRDAYRFDRHLRRSYFTLLQGRRLQEALVKLELFSGGHVTYAAFSAAELQAPHVRQPKTWLFVSAEYEDEFREVVEAKLVDSGENLIVLIPEDTGVFYLQEDGLVGESQLACTNAVQTYVDLYHCGGRGEEAAEAVLEQRLKPAWQQSGLL